MEFRHYSVLLRETIEQLQVKPDGIYVDGTLGGGGHASEVCRLLTRGHLYGIDQDGDAIAAARERLAPFGDRVTFIRDNYRNVKAALSVEGVEKADGIVVDLGVSSYQFDNQERGFSYRFDAPLDMRMDRRQTLTAKEIVNDYPESDLYRIIRDYGEDRFAKNIAKHIVRTRADKPIETTYELNEVIKAAVPAKMRQNGHPSKQTFQALRIECNRELEVLRDTLDDFIDILNPGGRLCVITFHSLEDRIVKTTFRKNEAPCTCPPEFPVCVCGKIPKGSVVTKKPILPGEEEIAQNARSKSAKLRVFQKA
ncbi:MAG: 16S rRNA (cytosine(1402)-N(4))-methyltransferase RsmH [Lachnospiraceae bacterium]|uniref:16S rRNA (cytosine(1402)-N(4))-methyltransferase RsmH n=1 Tax=uncultured Acetatifactor sp. TaxID=1671927 RepID=UPI00262AE1FD|nr:16S rRNA (cytosine(1402)-N(4))-methyltransferase RsmH [uncultured Acetatifactor sp.]MCI8789025.1 16S rRNA (cytosine(1402)-N(4))-methyltransferase RsmH [Lachnospiraceae bacterium]